MHSVIRSKDSSLRHGIISWMALSSGTPPPRIDTAVDGGTIELQQPFFDALL